MFFAYLFHKHHAFCCLFVKEQPIFLMPVKNKVDLKLRQQHVPIYNV